MAVHRHACADPLSGVVSLAAADERSLFPARTDVCAHLAYTRSISTHLNGYELLPSHSALLLGFIHNTAGLYICFIGAFMHA